jgi:hypothetical protein
MSVPMKLIYPPLKSVCYSLENRNFSCILVCSGPSYLAIAHVRDQLIAPAERQEKAQTWDQVVQYIRHKESRVREEIQHIAGDEFRLVSQSTPDPALHSRGIIMFCHVA